MAYRCIHYSDILDQITINSKFVKRQKITKIKWNLCKIIVTQTQWKKRTVVQLLCTNCKLVILILYILCQYYGCDTKSRQCPKNHGTRRKIVIFKVIMIFLQPSYMERSHCWCLVDLLQLTQLLETNRKSCRVYWIAPFLMTSSDCSWSFHLLKV